MEVVRALNVLSMVNVGKSFGRAPLLKNVDFAVDEGKIYSIQGSNGSGKSVLLKLMCRVIRPDNGFVSISPEFLDSKSVFPRFGVLIDRPGYIPSKTGLDNLRSLAAIRKTVGDEDIVKAMEVVGLDPELPQRVRDYSLGMKQKLGLVQAFMENQRVLLLDEPFNALDKQSVERVRKLLLSLRDSGCSIVFTSHSDEDVAALAEAMYWIEDGYLRRHEVAGDS